MDPAPVRTAAMDPELEAFIPLFPPADLTDPVTAGKNLGGWAAAVRAPDTAGVESADRPGHAAPEVAVRIYPPHPAQASIVWLDGGEFVMGGLDPERPAPSR